MSKNKSELIKNIKDLEHKKLISDYNASLAAIISVTLGIVGISYQISKSWILSFLIGIIAFSLINSVRKDIEDKIKNKIDEIKNLE